MRPDLHLILSLSTLLLLTTTAARAQTENVIVTNPHASARGPAYWTPERFKAAKPMPSVVTEMQPQARDAPRLKEARQFRVGRPPAQHYPTTPQGLYTPTPDAGLQAERVVTPTAVGPDGPYGGHYTSTRVFPMFTGAFASFSADRAYPYITIGKLFFSINGTPHVCSGAVIQSRIVATAGSCAHRGSGGSAGFHSNFVFVPAYRDGNAPLMSWHWSSAAVSTTWASGGGNPKNAANYALIEFADQRTSTGALVALGAITGWLGWETQGLDDNHISKLGYACNLDNCEKMQNITSGGAFYLSVPNMAAYGSDAREGSEGNAWVQNFQVPQVGGGTGFNTESNRLVGVTATYLPEPGQIQSASILDSRWVSVFNTICARRTGNCI